MAAGHGGRRGLTRSLQKLTRGLQSLVDPAGMFVSVDDTSAVMWHGRHVCRIETLDAAGQPQSSGTGFLVGPDLVLTNMHVVENVAADTVQCRFDFHQRGPLSFRGGKLIAVTSVVATRTYSAAEGLGTYDLQSTVHPSRHELDYALLRLEETVGLQRYVSLDGVTRRGWIHLSDKAPAVDPLSEVYILQHPLGQAMQIARGLKCRDQPAANRVRYETNTDLGSSGSPCFQFANDPNARPVLVALHNYGDPGWATPSQTFQFNHGVRIERIAEDIGIERLPPPPPPPPPMPYLLLAALAWLVVAVTVFLRLPGPLIEGPTYAWVFPLNHSNAESRIGLVLNTRFFPHSQQAIYFLRSNAILKLGDNLHVVDSKEIVEMKERCLMSKVDDCVIEAARLKEIKSPGELEFFLAPQTNNVPPGWRTVMRHVREGTFTGFGYEVAYRLPDDAKVYTSRFSCEFSASDLEVIKKDARFDQTVNLPPGISPGVTCKSESP